MKARKESKRLSKNFSSEEEQLNHLGYKTWDSIKEIKDDEINKIASTSRATVNNLRRLRGIALLVSDIDISKEHAALLLHAGIASCEVLAKLTPSELCKMTGRLERLLRTDREPEVDLETASRWIQNAKNRQN